VTFDELQMSWADNFKTCCMLGMEMLKPTVRILQLMIDNFSGFQIKTGEDRFVSTCNVVKFVYQMVPLSICIGQQDCVPVAPDSSNFAPTTRLT